MRDDEKLNHDIDIIDYSDRVYAILMIYNIIQKYGFKRPATQPINDLELFKYRLEKEQLKSNR